MKSKRVSLHALSATAAIIALGHPASAAAQAAGSSTGTVPSPATSAEQSQGDQGDIVVTANKREENISKVGLTITAVTGDVLKSRGVSDISGLTKLVPGFTATTTAFAQPVYTLRGVGFYESSLANYPTTSVYVDQMPLPFPSLAQHNAYDLERVEVLKGPQGTLFGQNATGGAINFIAAKPTSTFEAGGDVSYGRFNRFEGNAYVSGPLTNNLQARIAINGVHSGDWQQSYLDEKTNGATKYIAGRAILSWQPTSRLTFDLTVSGWKDNSEAQASQIFSVAAQGPDLDPRLNAQPLSPLTPRAAAWGTIDPYSNNRMGQVSLRSDYEIIDGVLLTGLTSFISFRQDQGYDADGSPISVGDVPFDRGRIESFSQELRVSNRGPSGFRWVAGANFEHSIVDQAQEQDFRFQSTSPGFGFTGDINYSDQRLKNYAFFGNVETDLNDYFTIKGGIRYTRAQRRATQCSTDNGDGTFAQAIQGVADAIQLGFIPIAGFTPPGIPAPPIGTGCTALDNLTNDGTPITYLPGAYRARLDENNVSWRGGVDYKPMDGLLLYVNVAKGYKAGSFPLSSAATFAQYVSVTQESLLDYEGGFKFVSGDRRFRLNGAAYYYDYTDKQLRGKILDPIFGNLEALRNVPKSRIWGIEGDVSYTPVKGLTLSASGSYMNTKITKYVDISGDGILTDFSGFRIPYAPSLSGTASVDYRWTTGNVSPFVNLSASGQTSQEANIGGNINFTPVFGYRGLVPYESEYTIPGYALFDARIGFTLERQKLEFSLFARNLFDKYYVVNTYLAFDSVNRLTGMPRTFGATMRFRFE